MAIFKCKMCGGTLEFSEGTTVCECEYCGTKQTLPRLDDDRKTNLYDRANHFRRNNDFDKAMGIYEQILNEDKTDAEAYWSLVLCRYGIEYVEDPGTHKRVPTVNRAQYTSIFADEDYKAAIQYADEYQKSVYEDEAKTIDEIQKGILEISNKEEPFDVFICYKETDKNGRRTQDSVLANDLYHQLIQEGFKVFFSRITLEDKLGTAYEPYIFAALNSAKVMVVLGTKQEFFNAVWVKNEWSRYLALISGGAKKVLIPAYRDMDPYDLPEEFSHLQAQDMSKLGFMQDLIRGIKKMVDSDGEKAAQQSVVIQQSSGNGNINALLKRGNMALEDGEWQKADDFFEEVLNQDAECAEAYLGKWLVKIHRSNVEELIAYYVSEYDNPKLEILEACEEQRDHILSKVSEYQIENYLSSNQILEVYKTNRNYKSILSSRKKLKEEAISNIKSEKLYVRAKQYASGQLNEKIDNVLFEIERQLNNKINAAQKDDKFSIASVSEKYSNFITNSDEKVRQLYDNATKRRENDYQKNIKEFNEAKNICDYKSILQGFKQMKGYQSSGEYIKQCNLKIQEIEKAEVEAKAKAEKAKAEAEEKAKKKRKKITIMSISVAVACIVGILLVVNVIVPVINYNKALALKENGKYPKAAIAFGKAGNYKDAKECSFALWDEIAQRDTVSVGSDHSVGLKSDGTVVDSEGKSNASDWTDIIAISAGYGHTLGLKPDGTVVAVGDNEYGQCDISDWTDIMDISAGYGHTLGLKPDGTVVAVGDNEEGQCEVSDWTDIIAVSAGYGHTLGLKSDGTVVAVGDNEYGQCDVSDWTDIIAISAGYGHSVGLKSDGTVVAVGYNIRGQCNVSDWTDIIAISAGYGHTVGLKSDGTVMSVGGQRDVSGWTDIVAISTGYYHSVGLKPDGTVVAVGDEYSSECDVSGWKDIKLP